MVLNHLGLQRSRSDSIAIFVGEDRWSWRRHIAHRPLRQARERNRRVYLLSKFVAIWRLERRMISIPMKKTSLCIIRASLFSVAVVPEKPDGFEDSGRAPYCFGFSLGVLVFGSLLGIKDFPLSLQRGTSHCEL